VESPVRGIFLNASFLPGQFLCRHGAKTHSGTLLVRSKIMLAAHAAWSEMAVVKTAALTDALAAEPSERSEPG